MSQISKSLEARIMAKVVKGATPDDCWGWTGAINPRHPYAIIGIDGRTTMNAHRAMWIVLHGPLPRSVHVRHTCKTKHCVNPRHLELGTHAENMADKKRDGTENQGERNGQSKLTADQVREIRWLCAQQLFTHQAIADEIGISCTHITNIKNRKTWRHL